MARLQVSIGADERSELEELARRLRVPGSAAARLVLSAGLELVRRDPAVLLRSPSQGAAR
ncbi:MAG: hypothetical protein KIT58_15180 [Planctomycetota bacterium]|nr:hypothetical protein [Planctomycetota bacterium]